MIWCASISNVCVRSRWLCVIGGIRHRAAPPGNRGAVPRGRHSGVSWLHTYQCPWDTPCPRGVSQGPDHQRFTPPGNRGIVPLGIGNTLDLAFWGRENPGCVSVGYTGGRYAACQVPRVCVVRTSIPSSDGDWPLACTPPRRTSAIQFHRQLAVSVRPKDVRRVH